MTFWNVTTFAIVVDISTGSRDRRRRGLYPRQSNPRRLSRSRKTVRQHPGIGIRLLALQGPDCAQVTEEEQAVASADETERAPLGPFRLQPWCGVYVWHVLNGHTTKSGCDHIRRSGFDIGRKNHTRSRHPRCGGLISLADFVSPGRPARGARATAARPCVVMRCRSQSNGGSDGTSQRAM